MTDEQFEQIMDSLDAIKSSIVGGVSLLVKTIALVHGITLPEEDNNV